MATSEFVRFKGTRQGVHVILDPDADLPGVLVELDQRLKGTDQFFRSASVMLNAGDREMDDSDVTALQDVLARYGLTIVSVEASHTDTRSVFRGMGLPVEMPESPGSQRPGGDDGARAGSSAGEGIVVHRNLRSGQSVTHHGDICLIGDVNPGAEIIAGHNVIVWGSLRGVVQAGMTGGEAVGDSVVVCALELAPTQLRIGSLVTRQPEGSEPASEVLPELARVVDGQIVVEQWIPRSRRVKSRHA